MKTSFHLLAGITLLTMVACCSRDIHAAQGKARKTGTLVGVVVDKGNNKNMNQRLGRSQSGRRGKGS